MSVEKVKPISNLDENASSLSNLRGLFDQYKLYAYVVPTADAHQSEYVPDFAQRRSFISGFTGSAGTAVITKTDARLWTDGRYFLQASQQLSEDWTLMKDRLPETPSIEKWIVETIASTEKFDKDVIFNIGIDQELFSSGECKAMQKCWDDKRAQGGPNVQLKPLNGNLVDQVWSNQPKTPQNECFVLENAFAGQSVEEKLKNVREQMKSIGADALAVSALDEVVWLYNIRGNDIDFNPVVISYAIVEKENAIFFCDDVKVSDSVKDHLKKAGVSVSPYLSFFDKLTELSAKKQKIWLDPATSSYATSFAVPKDLQISRTSPIPLAKAIKNETEVKGARDCHIRDAVAVCSFLHWLETSKTEDLPTEIGASDWLDNERSKLDHFVSLSFDTISGSGPDGAIIHYKASKETDRQLAKEMYLCDSGGQYRDGTTDITRTTHLGEPSDHEKQCYTRVLQGHLDLGLAVFPKGTSGGALDIVARLPLYSDGLDFRHGTGHGVGAFLNVHEGPHGISFRESSRKQALIPGMLVTNEPGYYEDNGFGIRIENVMVVVQQQTKHNFGGVQYYGFEHITLVPYCRKLVNMDLLSSKQIQAVNTYHKEVLAKVGPPLKAHNAAAYEWLVENTKEWTK